MKKLIDCFRKLGVFSQSQDKLYVSKTPCFIFRDYFVKCSSFFIAEIFIICSRYGVIIYVIICLLILCLTNKKCYAIFFQYFNKMAYYSKIWKGCLNMNI